MKVLRLERLISTGTFPSSAAYERVHHDVREAIDAIRWPPDGPNFTIYPQSGKKRGEGNGVVPIKNSFVVKLNDLGWKLEHRRPRGVDEDSWLQPGAFDAYLDLSPDPSFVVEWETGNISSSHRAINKIALGMQQGWLSGGLLVLPSRSLYRYLTDRIGNFQELAPYFPLWRSLNVEDGYLGVVEVEHDATSMNVPRIAKGTDGRALI